MGENQKNEEESKEKKQGIKAEEDFAMALNKKEIPFIHIEQNPGVTFSEAFWKEEKKQKRPDYFLLSKNRVFIDVKAKSIYQTSSTYDRFHISENDLTKLRNLESQYNIPVWLAFTEIKQKSGFLEDKNQHYSHDDYSFILVSSVKEAEPITYSNNNEKGFKINATDLLDFDAFMKKIDGSQPQVVRLLTEEERKINERGKPIEQNPWVQPEKEWQTNENALSYWESPSPIPDTTNQYKVSNKKNGRIFLFWTLFVLAIAGLAFYLHQSHNGIFGKKQNVGITTVDVNVRAGPSTTHKVQNVLKEKQEVIILEREGAWVKIRYGDGKTGFISGEFLKERRD
ncbi:MAG: SH3 domain-containing protein [Treponematales bacterium]